MPTFSEPSSGPGLLERPASADLVLDREYEARRPAVRRVVLSRLRTAFPGLDDTVVDASYNQAWHAIYTKLAAGEHVEDLTALLVTITHRRALDELRSEHWDRRSDDQEAVLVDPDLDARMDDQTRLRHAFEAMRMRLEPRERRAAVLCYVLGLSRREAARRLGVRPQRMEKIMDGVSRKLADLAPGLDGDRWCREQRGIVRAYALGLLDPEGPRYASAAQHLAHCSGCRRQVIVLRGLGAAVPPWPVLAFVQGAATAGAGGLAGAGALTGAAPAGAWWQVLGGTQAAGAKLAVAASATLAVAGGTVYVETKSVATPPPAVARSAQRTPTTTVARAAGASPAAATTTAPGTATTGTRNTRARAAPSRTTAGAAVTPLQRPRVRTTPAPRTRTTPGSRPRTEQPVAERPREAREAPPEARTPDRTPRTPPKPIERTPPTATTPQTTEQSPPTSPERRVPPVEVPPIKVPPVTVPPITTPPVTINVPPVGGPPSDGPRPCVISVSGSPVRGIVVGGVCIIGDH